ncbi:deoxyribodipyrimidine photo-lyase [Dongia sp.]|uniref:cryptochrome/photolyase family protein n=1 Tax=Dongia sp. TaxID=1977262 RepID=UPI0035AFB3FF
MPKQSPHVVWFRRDLRLEDNPALAAAADSGAPVIPVFIVERPDRLGGAARWWRGRSLEMLGASLERLGSRLILREGTPLDAIMALLHETGARHLHINRRFEPKGLGIDAEITTEAGHLGIEVHEHQGNRLHEPWALKTLKGESFRVFTPFWRRLAENYRTPQAWPRPKKLVAPAIWPGGLPMEKLQEKAIWTTGMAAAWQPGEAGALVHLKSVAGKLAHYHEARDLPATDGTSRLSPHLAWGEISVHEIWRQLTGSGKAVENGFLRELGWRDFNTHLLYHFPRLPVESWSAQFRAFPWEKPGKQFRQWQKGLTGYPIIDAGMRQLWLTGWMHNRVRMITASFLIKDMLIDWREGEKWFWDTLVDADLAQNAGNWQWVAGCGADAAPYFRIFNPTTQSIKFDGNGDYIRRWVPELAKMPARYIHAPETAPAEVLIDASIRLGRDYPRPMVDHAKARQHALDLYQGRGQNPLSGPTPKKQDDLFS